MRCISCIENNHKEESRFCYKDQCVITDLVQEAIWKQWQLDEMILMIQDPNNARVASECDSRGILVRKIWIPEGTREDDLWETFTLLVGVPEENEEILFDITGGCHALPVIISLVAICLREVRNIKIVGIVYAAAPDDLGMRHFVDLKPLMGIIDWMTGVKTLTEFTDAAKFIKLLTGLQGELHRINYEMHPPTHLSGWSHLLGSFTNAVRLNRPIDALYAGWGITKDLPIVRDEIDRFAPALIPVIEDMKIIGDLAAQLPGKCITPEYLMIQHRLIIYQISKGLDFQAVSLSREWLISLTMILFQESDAWLNAEARNIVSRTLTGLTLTMQGKRAETTEYTHLLLNMRDWKKMVRIWQQVSDLRNDIAHCGMNKREESVRSLLKRTSRLPDELLEFARISGISHKTLREN